MTNELEPITYARKAAGHDNHRAFSPQYLRWLSLFQVAHTVVVLGILCSTFGIPSDVKPLVTTSLNSGQIASFYWWQWNLFLWSSAAIGLLGVVLILLSRRSTKEQTTYFALYGIAGLLVLCVHLAAMMILAYAGPLTLGLNPAMLSGIQFSFDFQDVAGGVGFLLPSLTVLILWLSTRVAAHSADLESHVDTGK